MKNSLVSKLITFVVLGLITISCIENSNEFDPKPVNGTNWVEVANVSTSVFSSSYNNQNINLISGEKLIYNFKTSEEERKIFDFKQYQSRSGWFKLPISKDFLVTRTELEINLFAINSNSISNPKKISPKDLDPSFTRFEDMPFWSGFDAFGLTEKGYVLVPYRTAVNGLAENNPSFILISLAKDSDNISINKTKVVKPNVVSYYDTGSVIFSNENYFYVKIGNNILKIDHEGNVTSEAKSDGINFMQFDDKIVGVGYLNPTKEIVILEAGLDGSNLNVVKKIVSNENPTSYKMVAIDNKIVAFKDDQIFELINWRTDPTLREINNVGIEGVLISSIFLTSTNEVMITTQCRTLCGGIYSKPIDKFFEYKKIE